jgi:hypothetical protein
MNVVPQLIGYPRIGRKRELKWTLERLLHVAEGGALELERQEQREERNSHPAPPQDQRDTREGRAEAEADQHPAEQDRSLAQEGGRDPGKGELGGRAPVQVRIGGSPSAYSVWPARRRGAAFQ